ncbi:hypothetical protein AB0M34_07515 [Nocardia sp. NPDC050193]
MSIRSPPSRWRQLLFPHITQDVPRPLLETLENGRYGRDYLAGLDARLLG